MSFAGLIVSIIACIVTLIGVFRHDQPVVILGVVLSCMSMIMLQDKR